MNALLFKTVFSKRLGKRVAVSEHASSQGKANGSSRAPCVSASPSASILAIGLLVIGLSLAWPASSQNVANNALPTGASLSAGAVAIKSSGPSMTIDQSSPRAAINWQSFNIGKDASVTVQQSARDSEPMTRITLLGFQSASTGGATATLSKLGLAPSQDMPNACTASTLENCACQNTSTEDDLLLCQSQKP